MIKPVPQPDWPESFVQSFANDRVEVFGDGGDRHRTMQYQNRLRRVLDAVDRYAKAGAKILDIAAAQGNYTLLLAEKGYDVTWNDIRAELVPYVQAKYEHGTVAYKAGNVLDMESAEHFDLVLALEVIEHVAHPDAFLQQALRLVEPGGILIVSTPNGGYFRHHGPKYSECIDPDVYESMQFKPDADGHIFCLSPAEFRQVAQSAGLEVLEMVLFNTVTTTGHCKLRYLHLPGWLIRAFERGVQRTSLRFRQAVCAAMLCVCRRSA